MCYRRRYFLNSSIAAAVLAALAGCADVGVVRPEQSRLGRVILLTGVASESFYHRGLVQGLVEAGVEGSIEVNQWGSRPFGTFRNLRSLEKNRQRAVRLAAELVKSRRSHPDAPITLIGYSGGGAMALWTAEALPEDFKLERIILLGAAISPDYDISVALARCRHGLVNFYSERDWFMAGLATEIFGSMDRQRTTSAGRVGFRDDYGNLMEAEAVEQLAWSPEWRSFGHHGGHSGWRAQQWAREVLASWIDHNLMMADASE